MATKLNVKKATTTILIPVELKGRADKYLKKIGMNLSSWVSDRLHRELVEREHK